MVIGRTSGFTTNIPAFVNKPLTHITPMSLTDGVTFERKLDWLYNYVINSLVPELDGILDGWFEQYKKDHEELLQNITNVKNEWKELFDQFMADVVKQLEGLNDQAMANLVKNKTSLFYQALIESYTYGARVEDHGVQGAVSKAVNDGSVVYIEGKNPVTGNIPDLWNVEFLGAGQIERDGYVFIPNPKPNPLIHENTIFVHAQNGVDSNDGLTPDLPIKTLARLQNILRGLSAAQAAGARWVVRLAGVFPDGQRMFNLPDFPLELRLLGESPVSGKPVTRINNTNATSTIGLWFEKCPSTIVVEDLHVDGFNAYAGYGILGKGAGDLRIRRCRFSNCSVGTSAIKNMDYSFTENYYESTCDTASNAQYNSSGTWTREQVDGCTNGYTVSRGTVAHIDYCTIVGTQRGVLVDMGSRVNCLSDDFRRNVVGVRTTGAGEWINAGCNFNIGTVDANETDFENRGVGRESRLYSTARNEWLIGDAWTAAASYQEPKQISGLGNQIVYVGSALGTLPENFFTDRTKKLRVVVYGYTDKALIYSPNVTLYVTNRDGTDLRNAAMGIVRAGTNGAFRVEFEVWAMNDTDQTFMVSTQSHGQPCTVIRNSRTVPYQTERLFRLYCEPMGDSDSVWFTGMETFLLG